MLIPFISLVDLCKCNVKVYVLQIVVCCSRQNQRGITSYLKTKCSGWKELNYFYNCNPYNCTTQIIRIKIVQVAMNHRRFFFQPRNDKLIAKRSVGVCLYS